MLTTQVKWSVNYESQVQKQCSTSTSNGRNAASVPWVLAETSDKTTKTPCNGAALPLRKPTYPLNWSFSPDMLIFLGGTPWTFWAQVDQIWPICCFVHTVDLSMFQICLLGQYVYVCIIFKYIVKMTYVLQLWFYMSCTVRFWTPLSAFVFNWSVCR